MFSEASAVHEAPDGGFPAPTESGGQFVVEVDPAWFQGPGAYGGLTSAMLLRAMSSRSPWQPRGLTVQFCAPVPAGPSLIAVELVRKGSATTFLSAQLVHDGRVCVHALGSFGSDRATDLDFSDAVLPEVPPVPALVAADFHGPFPAFLQNYQIWMAHGGMPFSGASSSRMSAWIRPVRPEPVDPALAVALLDAMPPAILQRATGPRPMSSVSLSCHFFAHLPDPSLDPAEPLLVDVVSQITHGGYSDQEGRLFTPAGRLLATARQLVAVIR